MANEDTKNFNAMLHDSKDMPKIQIITDRKSIEKYGGNKMYFAPPLDYDRVMKRVPYGRVTTVGRYENISQSRAARILPSRSQRGSLSPSRRGRAISVPGMKRRIGGR